MVGALVCFLAGIFAYPSVGAYGELSSAKRHLHAAKAAAKQLDLVGARAALARASVELDRALADLGAPQLAAVNAIPALGGSLRRVERLAAGTREAVRGAQRALDTAARLQALDGIGDLQQLDWTAVLDQMRSAGDSFVRARTIAASATGWLPARVRKEYDEFLDDVEQLIDTSQRAHVALTILRSLLAPPRNVLVVMQNSADERATGGFPDQAALVTIGERITLTGTFSDDPLPPTAPKDVDWFAVNTDPDFGVVGPRFASFASAVFARNVDVVVAIDTAAVQHLVKQTGDLIVEGRRITGDSYARVANEDIYRWYPESRRRQVFEDALVAAFVDRLFAGSTPVTELASSFSGLLDDRHIQFWSGRAAEQRGFEELGVAGRIRSGDVPVLGVFGNVAQPSTKVLPHTTRSIEYGVRLDVAGTASARMRVGMRNDADPARLPDRVLGPARGTVHSNLRVYGLGAEQRARLTAAPGEQGSVALAGGYETKPGEYRLRVVHQARLVPDAMTISITVPPGARITSASNELTVSGGVARWSGELRRDFDLVVRYA